MGYYPQKDSGLNFLDRNAIECIAHNELKEAYPGNLNSPKPLNADGFLCDYQGLLLQYAFLGIPGYEILGATVMTETAEIPICDLTYRPTVIEASCGTVFITTELGGQKNLPRCRYTKIHEGAHWILHRHLGVAICNRIERYGEKNRTEHDWMEWQADSLAAALLMPRDVFYDYARTAIRKAGSGRGYLTKGSMEDRRVFYESIGNIAAKFCVSKRAAQIRMVHLGLIKVGSQF